MPDVSLRVRRNGEWATVTSADLFANKNVVVFSLPGAFTPTCSSTHLPRYNELAPAFKAAGIDAIVCVSVNDPFVMEAWAKDQEAANVTLLPDGNGEFTRKMGLLVDKSDLNFGQRSWRYSMLVRDGVDREDVHRAGRAGRPVRRLGCRHHARLPEPEAKKPDQVAILTREGCSFCAKAKRLLTEAGIAYAEVPLGHAVRTKVVGAITGAQTVPQVFINGRLIGNAEDLERHLKRAA